LGYSEHDLKTMLSLVRRFGVFIIPSPLPDVTVLICFLLDLKINIQEVI